MAHAGLGVGSFLKDVWPETCAIPYFEWYYNWPYPDRTPYDAEAADPLDARARNRIRNAPLWADFLDRDPRALPDPLPGGAVPRMDARPADGDARRRRHRSAFPGPHSPGEGRDRTILARWGVPADLPVAARHMSKTQEVHVAEKPNGGRPGRPGRQGVLEHDFSSPDDGLLHQLNVLVEDENRWPAAL